MTKASLAISLTILLSTFVGAAYGNHASCIEPFHIMTYNTMLRDGGIFTDVKDKCRTKAIGDKIKKNPRWDILALQEVWDSKSKKLLNRLVQAGYRYKYAKKPGLVIAYKSAKFQFKTKKIILYKDVAVGSSEAQFGKKKGFLAVHLKHKSGSLWVINTHTQADRDFPPSPLSVSTQKTRNKQIRQIKKFIDKHRDPVIVLGDFNTKNNSKLIKSIIGNSFINLTGSDSQVTFQCDKYKLKRSKCYPKFNGGKLDYIFGKFNSIKVISKKSKTDPFRTGSCKKYVLSDHRVLESKIELKFKNPRFSCSKCESGHHKKTITTTRTETAFAPFNVSKCKSSCKRRFKHERQEHKLLHCIAQCNDNKRKSTKKVVRKINTVHCVAGANRSTSSVKNIKTNVKKTTVCPSGKFKTTKRWRGCKCPSRKRKKYSGLFKSKAVCK